MAAMAALRRAAGATGRHAKRLARAHAATQEVQTAGFTWAAMGRTAAPQGMRTGAWGLGRPLCTGSDDTAQGPESEAEAEWEAAVAKKKEEGVHADAKALVSQSLGGSALRQLVVVPLRGQPLLPGILMPVPIRDPALFAAITDLKEKGQAYVGAFMYSQSGEEERMSAKSLGEDTLEAKETLSETLEELQEIGSLAQVHHVSKNFDDNTGQILLMAHRRISRVGLISQSPPTVAVEHLKDKPYDHMDDIVRATTMEVVSSIKQLLLLNPLYKEQVQYLSRNNFYIHDPSRIADLGATLCSSDGSEIQTVLEELDVQKRLEKTLLLLKKELELNKIQHKISKQVEDKMSTDQRRYFLMEQLKSIKKELGMEKDDKSAVVSKFEEKFEEFKDKAPAEAVKVIEEELQKLSGLESTSPEFNVTRNYLEWLTVLPWGKFSEERLDVEFAKEVLDEDHYGLNDVKERILEFIAVATLQGETQGKIICLVGPPGVGKTSIGKSIARALGRKYYRFSVGGLSDVAEIKGHRRTYIGAMPGKLVQCLKASGTQNPLVLIDEIDKLGRGVQGDPASALLEMLDPEQNTGFVDHYLDVPLDLSKVLFVCTANVLDTIPAPLLDRMEVIRLSGYIASEKLAIAQKYLEPEAKTVSGVSDKGCEMTTQAMQKLIDEYCREAGVRNLKNHIEKVYRKVALELVRRGMSQEEKQQLGDSDTITISEDNLQKYLGPPTFTTDRIWDQTPVGVSMGLAWTSLGGSTLYVEASVVERGEGRGSLTTTGSLGEVMKESSMIAYACARDCMLRMDPGNSFFNDSKIHIHVPAGATPKDGPSAGCTMITALLSLALERSVVADLAMTGEVTLTGRVLPVGGIKEKVIAARRSGVKTILLPKDNQRDFDELAEEIKEGLRVEFVETYHEVVDIAFPREA